MFVLFLFSKSDLTFSHVFWNQNFELISFKQYPFRISIAKTHARLFHSSQPSRVKLELCCFCTSSPNPIRLGWHLFYCQDEMDSKHMWKSDFQNNITCGTFFGTTCRFNQSNICCSLQTEQSTCDFLPYELNIEEKIHGILQANNKTLPLKIRIERCFVSRSILCQKEKMPSTQKKLSRKQFFL